MATPMTPKQEMTLTAAVGVLMLILLVRAYLISMWWPILMITIAYAGATAWTVVLQRRNPAAAHLIRRVFAVPSACAGVLATFFVMALRDGHALVSAFR